MPSPRLFGALIFTAIAMGAFPGGASACVAAWFPSPAYIAEQADVIVLGEVVGGSDLDGQPDPVDLEVLRVIKGDPGPSLHVERPRLGICGDDLGYLNAHAGSRVVLATGVEGVDGSTLTPTWIERGNGRWIAIGYEFRSLSALISAFDLPLPETSTTLPVPRPASPAPPVALLSTLLGALTFVSWLRRQPST